MLLQLKGVSKTFGATSVLDNVSLEIDRAQALGLIGDNGAGKSTLVKILSGVYAPSSGSILWDGNEVNFQSPLEARASGIEMIYQDLGLCPDLDVSANVFLGRELRRRRGPFRVLDRPRMKLKTAEMMTELRSHIDPTRVVGSLSGGEKQLVAVARGLQFAPRLFVMDEPTAALSTDKIHMLLRLVQQLKEREVSILLISHRFSDILHVCDKVLVMRMGRIVGTIDPKALPEEQTIMLMNTLMTGSGEEDVA